MTSPKERELSRRALFHGTLALTAASLVPRSSGARGRTSVGGRATFHIPWPLNAIDPHRLDDGACAILNDALFDTLYGKDERGGFVPILAEGEPEAVGAELRVNVRVNLKSARGRAMDARDAAASIARARANGARAWLAEVPAPRVAGQSLFFQMRDAPKLVRALASPMVAVVPIGFTPTWPDGTGPFRAERRADGLLLQRNANAARGPAFLDEVFVRPSADLGESLRAFETGADDIGWLGLGLHAQRPFALPFDAGHVAWAVLLTGRDAADWDAPGVAQRVANELPPSRLSYLGLGAPWTPEPAAGWGGPPCTIIVRDDAPWLIELARVVAAIITRPAHEVVAKPVSAAEVAQRRGTRSFPLAIDVVRPIAHGALGALVALSSAENPAVADDIVKHPPRLGEVNARTLTRSLRLGVLGEIRVQGGRVPDLNLVPSVSGFGIDYGASTRARHGG